MSTTFSPAQRLQAKFARKHQAGGLTRSDGVELLDGAGRLTIRALQDDSHPLTAKFQQLRKLTRRVSPAPTTTKPKSTSMGRTTIQWTQPEPADPSFALPEHCLFMPQPGINLKYVRELWPCQMLLYAAAKSKHLPKLTAVLDLTEPEIKALVAKAEGTLKEWSPSQMANCCLEALNYLDVPEPALELNGTELRRGADRVELTALQLRLIRALNEQAGTFVSFQELRAKHHIVNPPKLKTDLNRKLREHNIDLGICTKGQSYMLATPLDLICSTSHGERPKHPRRDKSHLR